MSLSIARKDPTLRLSRLASVATALSALLVGSPTALASEAAAGAAPPPLAVIASGNGTVEGGVSCPAYQYCSFNVKDGTTFTVEAHRESGWVFAGWLGGCSGTSSSCTFTVHAPMVVTARFAEAKQPLVVAVDGPGAVVSEPAGVSCPPACDVTFDYALRVRLIA